jgi:hypothetical protein
MNKKFFVEKGREGARKRWGDKFETFARLSKYIAPGEFWNDLKKRPPSYAKSLLKYYERAKR